MERLVESRSGNSRGSMLIVAMGILALMSIMAVTFARLMKLEGDASANYIDMIRAKLLAESGQSHVVVCLSDTASGNHYDSIDDPWVYKDKNGDLAAGTPIEEADNPSYEGKFGGPYAPDGSIYKTKVIDCASQINLNGRQGTLPEMLENLAAAIAEKKAVDNPLTNLEYGGSAKAEAICEFRDSLANQKFSSKMQLLELFQESERKKDTLDADKVGLEKFNIFKDYVTANSWINERAAGGNYNNVPEATSVPGQCLPEPRAPVNINTATEEVLIACLQGIGGRGRYVGTTLAVREPIGAGDTNLPTGQVEETSINEAIEFVYIDPITKRQAEAIAKAIIDRRSGREFESHTDFEYFIDTDDNVSSNLPVYTGNITDNRNETHFRDWYKQAARDMLKANFNPNARINHYNPNVSIRLIVDKNGLCRCDPPNQTLLKKRADTTEFCFSSMGYFEITSLGRVLDTKGGVVAEAKVRSVVKLFETIVHTSQSDFELAEEKDKDEITSFPDNVRAFDTKGDRNIGYIQLRPLDDPMDPSSEGGYAASGGGNEKLLAVRFDQEKYVTGDELSIAYGETNPVTALQYKPDSNASSYKFENRPEKSDIFPDGFYISAFRSRVQKLRYRAAAATPGTFGSYESTNKKKDEKPSQGEVNVPMYAGGIEFWIKPEFDSDAKVFSGYLFVSTIRQRDAGSGADKRDPPGYVGGTQMFFFKNTDGSLRLVRVHFEAFYHGADELYPTDTGDGGDFDPDSPDSYPEYPEDRPYRPDKDNPIGRPLPHQDLDLPADYRLPPIRARAEIFANQGNWGGWKAGEWHHVFITWDDASANTNEMAKSTCCLRLLIDGKPVGDLYPSTGSPPKPVVINQVDPEDAMYVGRIYRKQRYTSDGLFKLGKTVEAFANATIDGFITYKTNNLTIGDTPGRFDDNGEYENSITIPFPPGIDRVKFRAIEYTAYAPTKYCNRPESPGPAASGPRVVDLVCSSGGGGTAEKILRDGGTPGVEVVALDAAGREIKPGVNDEILRDPVTGSAKVTYRVKLSHLYPGSYTAALVSPVLDSVQISYYLPKEEVVLFEKIVE